MDCTGDSVIRTVYIPPFEKNSKDGAPGLWASGCRRRWCFAPRPPKFTPPARLAGTPISRKVRGEDGAPRAVMGPTVVMMEEGWLFIWVRRTGRLWGWLRRWSW